MTAQFTRLTLPAQISCLQPFLEFVHNGTQASSLTPADIDKLDLILEELLVNIARYAYAGTETGDIELAYAFQDPARLLVQISDTGHAFDPLSSDPPDFSRGLGERPLGGMGIFLVKSIAESITYRREGGRNTVSFLFAGAGNSQQ